MVHMTLQIFDITVEAHVRVAKQCDRRPRFVGEAVFQERVDGEADRPRRECFGNAYDAAVTDQAQSAVSFISSRSYGGLFDRDASIRSTTGPEAAQGFAQKADASWLRTRS